MRVYALGCLVSVLAGLVACGGEVQAPEPQELEVGSTAQGLIQYADYKIKTRIGAKCYDNYENGSFSFPSINTCNGGLGQDWTFWGDGSIRTSNDLCLDNYETTVRFTAPQLSTCNGGAGQKWTYNEADGTLKANSSGYCLDTYERTDLGFRPQLNICNGGVGQKFDIEAAGRWDEQSEFCGIIIGTPDCPSDRSGSCDVGSQCIIRRGDCNYGRTSYRRFTCVKT